MASTFCYSLLILLYSLSLVTSQYVLPDHYFINCGSNSDIDFTGRKFVSDVNPSTFSVSGGHVAAENNNPATGTPTLYRTARVFTRKSAYELEADENNTFVMVRLHFSPFSTNNFQFSNSKLDVSVSGFTLLSGFSIGNATVIREFIIPIGSNRRFTIEFTPSGGSSFVNAIEAYNTPSNLFRPAASFPRFSPTRKLPDLEKLTSDYAFNPVHRVNVGGPLVNVDRDTLRRTWTPDDSFIFNEEPARNRSYDGRINYQADGASSFDAPDDVYKTAKQLNNSLVNITWNFDVDRNTMYLVRVHFCDIISTALDSPTDAFNFFLYSHHREEIQPGNRMVALQAPFYIDMVVDSVDSDLVNISIGAIRGNGQPAFLNGVEIMELLKNSGVSNGQGNGKKGKSVFIVVGCVVAGIALLLVLLAGFFIGSRCAKQKPVVVVGAKSESHVVPSYGQSSYTSINVDFTINHPSPQLNLNLRVPFADILQATNNFDDKLMIGRGGFGKVYKGNLHGKKVAVKRAEPGHGQGRPEFVTEINVLSIIRHKHLVALIGYCDENAEMLLVYEFMEKGTLQDHLYDNPDHPRLSWERRLEICISATRGLHYLHTGSEGGIIHRDVKSTNILLNEQYVAKVADFGISRVDNVDESEMSDVKGSFGYLDPEYVRCMKLTQKSDVYSFGVVLLEVLCARPALDPMLPPKERNLADWAIKQIKNGNVEKIIDPFLAGTINEDSLRKFVEIAERCLKETGDERPNMVDVLWDLEYVLKLQLMSVDRESYDDTTINASLQLPTSIIDRLPSRLNDDSDVNDSSVLSYPSESQVFSQLKIEEAR